MKRRLPLLLAALVLAGSLRGGTNDPALVSATIDSGGGRSKSTNQVYTNDGSIGAIGGISAMPSPTPGRTLKHGYVGQLYDVVGLALNASPTSMNEGQTRQLAASAVLDDATFLTLGANSVSWSVLNGPITSISANGLATAGIVYQDTNANVQGTHLGFSSSLMLSVLNVDTDNFGIYAGDQVDDAWQVQYFGENSPNGLATADPDGDDQDNKFEFVAGLVPNDFTSRFRLQIAKIAGQPNHKQLTFNPRLNDRTYTPLGDGSALLQFTTSDNGTERTVTDLNASARQKDYQIQITKP